MEKEKSAKLTIGEKSIDLPLVNGTEGELGIDISKLRSELGAITVDPGYGNTGSCLSSISFIDGDRGILRHRGYDIEYLCENCSFVEVAYLLIYGDLPQPEELKTFRSQIWGHSLIHEDMKNFFSNYPGQAHPMAILSSMVCSLSVYNPYILKTELDAEERRRAYTQLLAQVRVLAAFAYKRSIGQPMVYPQENLDYVSNFLAMMCSTPLEPFVVDPVAKHALELLFILHADHEQNCSASTVRMVGSSKANLFAAVSAGISALWGPLHGGANQSVIEMLEMIAADGRNYKKYIDKAKDKNDPFRLMGFGHRIYKNFDPRAKIIKRACDDVLNRLGLQDPSLEVAKELEQAALSDPYFIERKLYPNVDFYSGIIYRALGIPTNMFTVMFALGRLPGWIAQWQEMIDDEDFRIARPRQIYVGKTPTERGF